MVENKFAINSDLENIRKWLSANKLSLNVARTEFIFISTQQMMKRNTDFQLNIHIEGKQVKQVSECKTLGVVIDQNLNWKSNLLYLLLYMIGK